MRETPLFDGKTFAGWTTTGGKPVGMGWEITPAGEIHCLGQRKGDIVTEREFLNIELSFEWCIVAKANSGLKYRWGRYGNQSIGIEYQMLDDPEGKDGGIHATASIYDLIPPDPRVRMRPVGEWNQSRIRARGPKLEHWLNGKRVAMIVQTSPQWRKVLEASKFKDAPDFGARPGKILLQDHGGEAWFRKLVLKEL